MLKKHKSKLAIFLIGIAFLYPTYFALMPAPYRPLAFQTLHEVVELPRYIAHKSNGGNSVPNSSQAVRNVLHSKSEGIELDIQLSNDGQLIVFHPQPEPIATLEQIFQLVGDQKFLFLDLKPVGIWDDQICHALVQLIAKYQLYESVIVESFNPLFLYHLKNMAPEIMVMYDFAEETTPTAEESPEQLAAIPWILKQRWFHNMALWLIKPEVLGPRSSVPLSQLRNYHTRGFPLIAWTVDDHHVAAQLFDNGVNGIQSNVVETVATNLEGQYQEQVQDASRLSQASNVVRVVIRTQEDISAAFAKAHAENRHISIAGKRHSQGGQTFADGNLMLDMRKFNQVSLLPDGTTARVQSGATWKKVQHFLNDHQRSVKVMQSDTLFTVGGSLSVNVHGWQIRNAPMGSTVKQFRMMLASGEVVTCSRGQNYPLFQAAIGGYGLIGVILDIDLQTLPNEEYRSHQLIFPTRQFPVEFKKYVTDNPSVQLAYGRLSIDKKHLFDEALLHFFQTTPQSKLSNTPIISETLVPLKAKIFRNSERSEHGKRIRWLLEKKLGDLFRGELTSRNNIMNPDVHTLWPLDHTKRDILQEYFIPKAQMLLFVEKLKQQVIKHDQNLLNVTIRDVKPDPDSLLAYARSDCFAFVLLFSQDANALGESGMRAFTQALIDDVLALQGTFYLPYRPHYTLSQLQAAYPQLNAFLAIKRQVDPHNLFTNEWYDTYLKDLNGDKKK